MKLYRQGKNLVACAEAVNITLDKLAQLYFKDLNKVFKSKVMNQLKTEVKTIIDICYPTENMEHIDVFAVELALATIKDLYNTLNNVKGNYPIIDKIKQILNENN